MFDYARKMQLAVSDIGRRAGLKAGAGVAAAIAAGFLIAALWTFLDRNLDWGPLGASLAVGVLFAVIAGVVFSMSSTPKHAVPSTDELKREVEARVSLATDAAMQKASDKAREVVDMAGNKVVSLMDEASFKASAFVDNAEAKVQQFTHGTVSNAARSVGLTPQFFSEAQQFSDKVKQSRAMPAASILGAFAIGLTLASRLNAARRSDWAEPWDEGDDDTAEWADDDWADDHRYV